MSDMGNEPVESVAKLDAALRQLETAVELFLLGGDAVSAHTLAAAGLAVRRDIGEKRGIPSVTRKHPYIRPEKQKEFSDLINRSANFFKHANKDPDPEASIEFRPRSTAFLLFDAFELYGGLTGKVPEMGAIFRVWFFLAFPTITLGKLRSETLTLLATGASPDDRDTFRTMILGVRDRASSTHLR